MSSDQPLPCSKLGRWAYALAVAALFTYSVGFCFAGLADQWRWGHDGFNGAAFSQAARNSLRHGIVWQAPYYFGVAAPGQADMYPDHPQMLHWHLSASQALISDAEWVNRLTPAIYSLLGILMLFLLARRLTDRHTALAAAGIYALIPLNHIFANMINHEQGGLFWCLTLVYAYCRWHQEGGRRRLIFCLAAVTLAVQFDWPGYYLAFLLAVHALWTGLRRHPGLRSWRPEYSWIAWFSAVVLLNFFGFFLWIYLVRGSLDNVIHSFHWRSAAQSGYLATLWERAWDLRGPILLGLLFLWPPVLIWRLIRRRAGLMDLAAGLFFLTQLIHSTAFQQAGRIHCYWTIYLGPTFALGGAVVLRELWLLLDRPAWPGRLIRRAALGAMLCALAGWQIWITTEHSTWGRRSGTAAYVDHYDDQWAEQAWVRQVSQTFDRRAVRYRIHSSVQRPRLEMSYYLDAPSVGQRSLSLPGAPKTGPRPILLIDLLHLANPARDRSRIAALADRCGIHIWDRRFVAVDPGAPAGSFRARRARVLARPWWWRWLVNPEHPPVAWEDDPAPWAAERALRQARPAQRIRPVGGRGGGQFEFRCGPSQFLTRVDMQTRSPHGEALVGVLRPSCQTVLPAADRDHLAALRLQPTFGAWFGRLRPDPVFRLACPSNTVAVGLHGHAGALLDGLGLVCAPPRPAGPEDREILIPAQGGSGGAAFRTDCPPGQAVSGLIVHAGQLLDGLSARCSPQADAIDASPEAVGVGE